MSIHCLTNGHVVVFCFLFFCVLLCTVHVATFTNPRLPLRIKYNRYANVTLAHWFDYSFDLFSSPSSSGAAASSSVNGRRVPQGTNEPKYSSPYLHCTADVSLSLETHLQPEIFMANTYSTFSGPARTLSFCKVQRHLDRTVSPLHSFHLPFHPDIPLFVYFNVFNGCLSLWRAGQ